MSGTFADMADLLRAEEDGDDRAASAIDLFCYRPVDEASVIATDALACLEGTSPPPGDSVIR